MQLISMQAASVLTLYAILIVAVVQDFRDMRISNRLIVVGLVLAVAFGIFLGGMPRVIHILWNISFPVIVLYLLYLLGVIGAGDIKLFSVVGGFTDFKTLTGCMLAAFVVAAVFSVGKMLCNRNLGFSLFKGQLFVKEVLQGNISSYRRTRAEERNLMHFSAAILMGLLLVRGYGHLY
jgi:prepilin peptidase CpaA